MNTTAGIVIHRRAEEVHDYYRRASLVYADPCFGTGSDFLMGNEVAFSDRFTRPGVPIGDVWEIPIVAPMAKERTGYPTQKPLALLRRVVSLWSNPGDLVIDPTCGSGTTLEAAAELGRQWVGIDSSPVAVRVSSERLSAMTLNERRSA